MDSWRLKNSFTVLFKTHFWDEFTRRQLQRVQARLGPGRLYVVVDESMNAAGPIEFEHVIRITGKEFSALGLAEVTTHGSVIWYNIDYPNYVAFANIPRSDYYISIEYDAIANVDLDALVQRIGDAAIDYVGFPIRKLASEWPWYDMHLDIYGQDMLVYLSCFSVFSARAVEYLLRRRQEMTMEFAARHLKFWPNNEAFIPNEIARAGFSVASLKQFGDTGLYDWWPPSDERDTCIAMEGAFLHPVLHGARYTKSLIFHEPSLLNIFRPRSAIGAKLNHLSFTDKRALITSEITRRIRESFKRRLEQAGLRRTWSANAASATARYHQSKSVHNSVD